MILELLYGLLATLWEGLCSALPALPVPAWLSGGAANVASVLGTAGQLGYWVPFSVAAVVVSSVVACLLAGLGIKVARIVASFLTVGGGSAG